MASIVYLLKMQINGQTGFQCTAVTLHYVFFNYKCRSQNTLTFSQMRDTELTMGGGFYTAKITPNVYSLLAFRRLRSDRPSKGLLVRAQKDKTHRKQCKISSS
jgi:hypothetical protein